MRSLLRSALLLAFPLGSLLAQPASPSTTEDSLFLRARELVTAGNGAAGRALVDSILAASAEGTNRYADALFWRASLAESASTSARDYLRLTVEYTLSPRVPDALLRLGQLELARGNRDAAVRHLERLVRDYPNAPMLNRANYWRGRALLEGADAASLARGCAAIARAKATTPATEVEFRNQMDYYAQRCIGVDTLQVVLAASPPATAPPAQPPASRPDTAKAKRQAAPPAPAARFAIQVAASKSQGASKEVAAKLEKRGYDTRIVEGQGYYRVWIGGYPTRAAANVALKELKAKKIAGFIVESK